MKPLIRKLAARLLQLSPPTITAIGLLYVLAIAAVDYVCPANMAFTVCYVLGVAFVAWRSGNRVAMVAISLASVAAMSIHESGTIGNLVPPWVEVWNALSRLAVLTAIGWLIVDITRLTRNLGRLAEERTAQWKREAEEHKATSARLGEAVERFEQVINNITQVFWLTDVAKEEMAYVSPAYEQVWGRKCEELYREPHSWEAALHPEDRDVVKHRARTEQAGGGYDAEYRILRPDGAVRWIRDRGFPVRNAQGEVYRVAGLAEDITERKRTREVLQTQAAILENMAEGVVVTDEQGLVVQMNPAAERIWGYPRNEVLGQPASMFSALAKPEATAVMRGVLAALQAAGYWRGTFKNRRKDGAVVSCEAVITRLAIQGQTFMVAVEQDVTERKQAELALAQKEELYRTLFELSPDGILLEDSDGNILDVNQAFCDSSGYSRAELLGHNVRCLVPPGNQSDVEANLAALRSGQTLEHEVWNVQKTGKGCLMRLKEKPLTLPDGRQGVLVVARDVTQTKRAELAKEAFLSLGTKLGTVKNPLEAARAIYATADQLWKWDSASLILSSESGELQPVLLCDVVDGQRREVPPARPGSTPTARTRRIMEQGAELILDEEETRTAEFATFGDTSRLSASLMCVPLRREGKPIGVLSFQSYTSHAYTQEDLRSLQALADHCGGALERIGAEQALREANDKLELRVQERTAELEAANAALRESEQKYRRLHETMRDAFVSVEMGGRITECNRVYQAMLGYTAEELSRMTYADLTPEKWHAFEDRVVAEQILPRGYSDIYEKEYRRKDGTIFPVELRTFLLRDAYGQSAGMWAIVRDITERKRAEEALRESHDKLEQRVQERTAELQAANRALSESEERYRSLVNNLNVGVYRNQPGTHGGFLHANPALARMHGYDSVEEFLKTRVADSYQDPQDREVFLNELMGKGTLRNYALRLKKRDGTPIYASVNATAHRNVNGEVDWIDGMIEDITERERAQEAQRASEERYRALAESSPDAIFILDRDIRVRYVNSTAAALWRRTPADLMGLTQDKLFPPETAQHHAGVVRGVFETGNVVRRDEPLSFPVGDQWIEIRLAPVYDAQRTVTSVMGICRDITERKRAERQLAEALDLNQKMIAASTMGIAAYKASGECVFANEALARTVGGSLSEVLQGNFRHMKAWQESGLLRLAEEALSQGQARSAEGFGTTRFGKDVWLDCQVASFVSNGEPHLLLMALDITKRIEAEAALKRAQHLQQAMLNNIGDPLWLKDKEGHFLACNEAMSHVYGLPRQAIIGKTVFDCIPGQAIRLSREDQEVIESRQPLVTEVSHTDAQGRFRWFENIKSPVFDEQGKVTGTVGSSHDVTARKSAEDALKMQSLVLQNMAEGALLLGPDQTILFANAALESMFSYGPGELIGKNVGVLNAWPAEETAHFNAEVIRAIKSGGIWHGEYENRRKDGTLFTTESRVIRLTLAGQDHFISVQQDITERKHAEFLLQAQRDLGVSLSLTSDMMVALTRFLEIAVQTGGLDCGGVYLLNQATQELGLAAHRGLSAAFAKAAAHYSADSPQMKLLRQGQSIFNTYENLPVPRDATKLNEGLRAIAIIPLYHNRRIVGALNLASHTVEEIPVQTRIAIEAIAAQAAGAIARISAEGERHRLERQILEISDREHARIGQDIHDGLCQQLVSLAFDANSLHRQLAARRRPEARTARRIAVYLDQAITETRQLSRGLFPVRFEREGLPPALEELAAAARNRFKIRCRFASQGPVVVENSVMATHLYRIAQEAVNNALKHSRARSISIRLCASEGTLELSVEDDGAGLSPATRKKAAGLGLHIMDYRARTIGGTLRVGPGRRGGTKVSCCVPRARE